MKVCSKCGWSTDNDEILYCQGCGKELVVEKNTVSNSSDEKSHAVQLEDFDMDHLDKYNVLTLILTRDEIRKESVKELIGMYLKVRQHLDDSMNLDQGPYALHLNSANDILIKKEDVWKLLDGDAKKRCQSGEKSISVLTNGDLRQKASNGKLHKNHNVWKETDYNDMDNLEF